MSMDILNLEETALCRFKDARMIDVIGFLGAQSSFGCNGTEGVKMKVESIISPQTAGNYT